MLVRWTVMRAPLGRIFLAATDRGLCRLHLADPEADEPQCGAFPGDSPYWRNTAWQEDEDAVVPYTQALDSYFAGRSPAFFPPLDMRGTVFQQRVWEELTKIAPGETVTYGLLARRIGRPGAARAVGQAVGANPIAIAVPCHRVLASDGSLGGFRAGLAWKRHLLNLEARGARVAASA